MIATTLRIVLTAVLIVEAIGDGEGEHSIDKRNVNMMAKLGQLPYQGKIMEKSSLDELAERLEDEQYSKRYLGALARANAGPLLRNDDADDFASGEDMRLNRLEALREELEDEVPEEKRSSMAVLARTGALPKRILDEDDIFSDDLTNDDKQGMSSIARNFQKRIGDDDLEQLLSEVYGIGEKRNVASLARGFALPQGKRDDVAEEDKRNLPSIVRDRQEPLGNGKRHIGAFVANHGIPFVNEKRNFGAYGRNHDFSHVIPIGKRDTSDEINKRLPSGSGGSDHDDQAAIKESGRGDNRDSMSQVMSKDDNGHERSKRATFELEKDKRYFAVRGGGKMPGGRIPKAGGRRDRNRNENSGRRRH